MNPWDCIPPDGRGRPAPPGVAPEAFWAHFKTRAAAIQRDPPARHRSWGPAAAVSGGLVFVLLAWSLLWRTPELRAESVSVTALTVLAPHDGALIVDLLTPGGKRSGALIWVSGLEDSHARTP